MKKVLVLMTLDDVQKQKIEDAGSSCALTFSSEEEVTEKMIEETDAVIGMPSPSLLKGKENLQWIQIGFSGADSYLKSGILGSSTVLTNATGLYGKAVGEHAFAVTLMLMKNFHIYRDQQKKKSWKSADFASFLDGKTVLVAGLGDIGKNYARLVSFMGAEVIGVRRTEKNDCPDIVSKVVSYEKLDEVLPCADVIMCAMPATPQTYHMFDRERFSLMKKTALLINCGRGNAVDSHALYEALSEHRIAAAGLDVTETEPLPEDSPLWNLENIFITPHISGPTEHPEIYDKVVDLCAENLRRFSEGRELLNKVDRSAFYVVR